MNLVKQLYFLLISLIIAIAGCGTPELLIGPAVTGVIYWANGEAHKYYEQEPSTLYRATKHVLSELTIPIKDDQVNQDKYVILAGEENRFKIEVKKVDAKISRIDMRINVLGDKDMAELIYKKIDAQLNIIQFDEQGNPTNKQKLRNKIPH